MHNSYFSYKLFDKYHQIQFQKNLMKRFRESSNSSKVLDIETVQFQKNLMKRFRDSSNSSKVLGPKMLHVSICGIIWILLKNPK